MTLGGYLPAQALVAAEANLTALVPLEQEPPLTQSLGRSVVSEVQRLVRGNYVFPERREKIASMKRTVCFWAK
jgi:hypothetical protein